MSKLDHPSYLIAHLYKSMSLSVKLAFISSLVFSLATHLFYFTNHLINHDAVNALFNVNDKYTSGRWFLKYVTGFSSIYDLSFVTGVICFLAVAASVSFLVLIFNIREKFNIVMLAGIFSVFPTLASTYLYRYTADGYAIALLLSTLSVYISHRHRWGFIFSGIMLGFVTGIYQAYLTYAISLYFLVIISLLLKQSNGVKSILAKAFSFVTSVGIGAVIYWVGVKFSLSLYNAELTSYQNLDKMGSFNIRELPRFTLNAYFGIRNFFFRDRYFADPLYIKLIYLVIFICIAYFLLRKMIILFQSSKLKALILLLSAVALPVFINSIAFTGANSINLLMAMSYVHFFVFLIILMDESVMDKKVLGNSLLEKLLSALVSNPVVIGVFLYLGTVAIIITTFNYYILDNKLYLKQHTVYENSFAFANRVAMRLESSEGFTSNTPVAFIGDIPGDYLSKTKPEFDGILKTTGVIKTDYVYTSPEKLTRFMSDWLGLEVTLASAKQVERLENSNELLEMSTYPHPNSIRMISGVIVVKMGD